MSKAKKLCSGMEGKYIANAFLSPVVMIGEVIMEVFIPFVMAKIIPIYLMLLKLEPLWLGLPAFHCVVAF